MQHGCSHSEESVENGNTGTDSSLLNPQLQLSTCFVKKLCQYRSTEKQGTLLKNDKLYFPGMIIVPTYGNNRLLLIQSWPSCLLCLCQRISLLKSC